MQPPTSAAADQGHGQDQGQDMPAPQFPPPPPLSPELYPVEVDPYFGSVAPIGMWIAWEHQRFAVYYHILTGDEVALLLAERRKYEGEEERNLAEGQLRLALAIVAVGGRAVIFPSLEDKLVWVRGLHETLQDQLLMMYQIAAHQPSVLFEAMAHDPSSAPAPASPGIPYASAGTSQGAWSVQGES